MSWSPDSKKIASACKSGEIRVWDPNTGDILGRPMAGHKKWINCLSWEPYHINPDCRRLASAGHDNDVRIWDTVLGTCVKVLAGHTGSVTAVRWGGKTFKTATCSVKIIFSNVQNKALVSSLLLQRIEHARCLERKTVCCAKPSLATLIG